MQKVLNGNEAIAFAMKQINPDVVAAYPITPSTTIPEKFSNYVANGEVETEFVAVESEHSALSACIGVSASGGRAITATASQGLALMHEVLVNASGMRLPILLANANRALSAPLSIHGDHSDSLMERDSGWIQFYANSPQEAYDLMLQGFLIGEDKKVRLPVMVCFDGFETSHLATNVEILDDKVVKRFVGEVKVVDSLFDFAKPKTFGGYTNPHFYFEAKRNQLEGMENSRKVIGEVGKQFGKISKRDYSKPIEEFEIKDAQFVVIVMGSASGSVKEAIRELRKKGKKVGMVRVRSFRPFPSKEILKACGKAKKIGILDRMLPQGSVGGVLFNEINSILFSTNYQLQTTNFFYGIGQRQFNPTHAKEVFEKLMKPKTTQINFVNLRG